MTFWRAVQGGMTRRLPVVQATVFHRLHGRCGDRQVVTRAVERRASSVQRREGSRAGWLAGRWRAQGVLAYLWVAPWIGFTAKACDGPLGPHGSQIEMATPPSAALKVQDDGARPTVLLLFPLTLFSLRCPSSLRRRTVRAHAHSLADPPVARCIVSSAHPRGLRPRPRSPPSGVW